MRLREPIGSPPCRKVKVGASRSRAEDQRLLFFTDTRHPDAQTGLAGDHKLLCCKHLSLLSLNWGLEKAVVLYKDCFFGKPIPKAIALNPDLHQRRSELDLVLNQSVHSRSRYPADYDEAYSDALLKYWENPASKEPAAALFHRMLKTVRNRRLRCANVRENFD